MQNNEIKTLCIRLPKDLWVFLKNRAVKVESSVAKLITEAVGDLKKKVNNKE